MASVDDRIVRMEFDNAAFERKTASTIATLGHLNQSLKMTGATQGLSNVSAAASKLDLSSIANSAETIASKFSAMSAVAISAINTIVSRALVAGAEMAKAFTVGPIVDGFQEMETNMNSIQTILSNTASKGTTLDQVNGALQELNEYSDKTIYNFGQMAKNIGTFTAAGVDLQTSVNSIKGIANLAAMSGSNSDQASSAMYQLSQALAAGKVSLMDWNSVVNAGMGGEVFKTALFETGKAMGTLAGVPLDQSFTEWEDAGNSFRTSLQDEWIDEEVLTTTLEAFSGDLTSTQLQLRGFSKKAADDMVAVGKRGQEAATSVKTLTQLMGTVKESIATGWADSFKAVIGGFEESKRLFTNINNFIGDIVSKSADRRNKMLLEWKNAGGRTLLLLGFKEAIQNLLAIFKPIKEAFREIFPAKTSTDLISMTQAFYRFAEALKPSQETVALLKNVFRGLFSIFAIGWEIIKEGTKFIKDLVVSLGGLGQGNYLTGLATIGNFFTRLREGLVDGGGIKDFFDKLREGIAKLTPYVEAVKGFFGDLFAKFDFDASEEVESTVGKIGTRFERLRDRLGGIGVIFDPFIKAIQAIVGVLADAWEAIHTWFSELGQKMADSLGPGDFDAAVDAVNVGLLGGIVLLLRKFVKNGFKLDVGQGFFANLSKSFEQLTKTLTAMQTNLKANALLKIAGAIGILTASMLILSLIDSAALTKALVAMAIGFGQLMISFALITKMSSGPKSAASFGLIATGMILLSTSMLILAGAMKILSTIDTEGLVKGLGGLTLMLGIMTGASVIISKNATSFIFASASMLILSAALIVLAGAVKLYGMMDLETIGKGLGAITAALLILSKVMGLMPLSLPLTAAGLVLVGVALNLIAAAMLIFGTMGWTEMLKGMYGIVGSLMAIGIAMNLMPINMPITAAGLILVGIALASIAGTMKIFASMDGDEIKRALLAMAGALTILAVATSAMQSTILGSVAIGIAAVALGILFEVIKAFASMKTEDLVRALIGIALALTVIGVAAHILLETGATVAILALGVALVALGLGIALIGAGAFLLAKAFAELADLGVKAAKSVGTIVKEIGKSIPAFAIGVAQGLVEMVMVFTKAAPVFAKLIGVLLNHIIDTVIKLIPKVVKAISELIKALLKHIKDRAPEVISTGLFVLVKLLEGIRNNIGKITNLVIEIVLRFVSALNERMGDIMEAGMKLLVSFLLGVANNIFLIVEGVVAIIKAIISELGLHALEIMGAGASLLIALLAGIASNVFRVIAAATQIITAFLSEIGKSGIRILYAAVQMIMTLIAGIKVTIPLVVRAIAGLITKFIREIGGAGMRILLAGTAMIIKLIEGFAAAGKKIVRAGVTAAGKFLAGLVDNAIRFGTHVGNFIKEMLKAIQTWIDTNASMINRRMRLVAGAILNGLTLGISGKAAGVVKKAMEKLASLMPGWMRKILKIDSPSVVFMDIGGQIIAGLASGITSNEGEAEAATLSVIRTVNNAVAKAVTDMGKMDEFSPTITPVLDLTNVQADASKIADYIQSTHKLSPAFSIGQARTIASETNRQNESEVRPSQPTGDVKFEQIINAPKQLSTGDIYKQTRNQIAMAKEELKIP